MTITGSLGGEAIGAFHTMEPSQNHRSREFDCSRWECHIWELGLTLLGRSNSKGSAPSYPSIQGSSHDTQSALNAFYQIILLSHSFTASPYDVHLTTFSSRRSLPFTLASTSTSIITEYLRTSAYPAPPSILRLHSQRNPPPTTYCLFPLYSTRHSATQQQLLLYTCLYTYVPLCILLTPHGTASHTPCGSLCAGSSTTCRLCQRANTSGGC